MVFSLIWDMGSLLGAEDGAVEVDGNGRGGSDRWSWMDRG